MFLEICHAGATSFSRGFTTSTGTGTSSLTHLGVSIFCGSNFCASIFWDSIFCVSYLFGDALSRVSYSSNFTGSGTDDSYTGVISKYSFLFITFNDIRWLRACLLPSFAEALNNSIALSWSCSTSGQPIVSSIPRFRKESELPFEAAFSYN